MSIFTVAFLKDAAERAAKTGAQFVLAGLALSDTGPVNAFEIDWGLGVGFAVTGIAFSLLTSIVSAPVSTKGTASLVRR